VDHQGIPAAEPLPPLPGKWALVVNDILKNQADDRCRQVDPN
jgi:hypothetical protein